MIKRKFVICLCLLLTGCASTTTSKTYEEGYNEGYEEGYRDGYDTKEEESINLEDISEYLEWDDVEPFVNDQGYLIVETGEYGQLCGALDGDLSRYPMSSEYWKAYSNDPNFADAYCDYYLDRYGPVYSGDTYNYKDVPMIDVSSLSDAILEVGYDGYYEILLIRWNPGNLYEYYDVDMQTFWDLITASSVASYANNEIKDKYEYSKVGE